MTRVALTLAALAAATVGLAQQTTQQAPAEPRASSTPQAALPADPSPRMSQTDKLILLGDCMRQVHAADPSLPEKDAQAYCDRRVKSYSFPRN